jgi:magnesium transporter
MVEHLAQGKLTWVCLKSPTLDEVQGVMDTFRLPPALMGDLTTTVPKSGAVEVDGAIKITIDFPVVKRIDAAHPYEVKLILTEKALITVQYEEMEAIDRFKKEFEVVATLNKASRHASAVHLFLSLMNELYASSGTKLDYVESLMAEIEAKIFTNNERHMVLEIARVSKKLIAFRHTIRAHEDVLTDLRPLLLAKFKNGSSKELDEIEALYFALVRRSNTLFENLKALHDTNSALLTTKQNEIMKTLTIMAFITFPLTLFTSMFGMNTEATPILGSEGDFWIIVGIMVVATIGFFIFFKHKNWI